LVSLATPEGELRFVNRAYADSYEKRPNELIGKSLFDFVTEDHCAAVARHLRTVSSLKHAIEDENQVRLPDGRTKWTAWTNRALFDAAGKLTLIHSVGRDIDRRVAAEQLLRANEARYRLLAENSTDVVMLLDLDLKRRYVSPACREVFGYEPDTLIRTKSGTMVHPNEAHVLQEALQSLLDGRADRAAAVSRRRHRDGHWIWVETRFRMLKDPQTGARTGIIAAVRDISTRKHIEEQRAEANRRLEALAAQDGLTDLANRRAFDEAPVREYRRARREEQHLALIM
jgi:PAS domain S-box-containing protein